MPERRKSKNTNIELMHTLQLKYELVNSCLDTILYDCNI